MERRLQKEPCFSARPSLGLALGAVSSVRSQATGRDQLVLTRRDADGFDLDPLVLGPDLTGAAEALGEADVFTL